MKRTLALFALTLTIAAVPAVSFAAKHVAADAFARADKNSDGVLDRDESRAVGIMNWHQMVCDTDSDSVISKAEYEACKDKLKSPAPVEGPAKKQ